MKKRAFNDFQIGNLPSSNWNSKKLGMSGSSFNLAKTTAKFIINLLSNSDRAAVIALGIGKLYNCILLRC